jgi:outer membrane usher protein
MAALAAWAPVHADERTPAPPLQLEVFINGRPAGLIGSFISADGVHLSAERGELLELGLSLEAAPGQGEIVGLDGIDGLAYRYDIAGQSVHFTVANALRGTTVYNAREDAAAIEVDKGDLGAVLNYDLFAGLAQASAKEDPGFSGASASLEARVFHSFGTFSQTATLRAGSVSGATRLDTSFTVADHKRMTTYVAGDVISGGFAWTRPIRMGGARVFRDFNLRGDLVTQPSAAIEGSAEVPSSINVYVDGLKTFSQDLPPGPYRIDGISRGSGHGEAQIVVRDAAGREQVKVVKLFSSQALLRPGLVDFSVEAGLPRLSYATSDDRYATDAPVASASLRVGIADWLTAEAHGEIGGGLVNAGAGIATRTGNFGVAALAFAASSIGDRQGAQTYASFETAIGDIGVSASSQMTFGDYEDLASVTADIDGAPSTNAYFTDPILFDTDRRSRDRHKAPRMLNRVAVSVPLSFGSVSASYIDFLPAGGDRSRLITASFAREVFSGAHFGLTGFVDLDQKRGSGVFAGLSIPLGENRQVSSSAGYGTDGPRVATEFSKAAGDEIGSSGWRLGASGLDKQHAVINYKSRVGRLEAGADRRGDAITALAGISGAIAAVGGDVFLSPRIDDGFAVVRTGVADVPVLHENRRIGTTDSRGRLLVAGLRSYERNALAIDATNLPVDVDVTATKTVVAPADRAGVVVDFTVRQSDNSAVVVLKSVDGTPVDVGARGQLAGGEDFVVGYDGRAYLVGLSRRNRVSVETAHGTCASEFDFAPRPGEQVLIEAVCG